jgi:glycosylphosphatidylinositol transamidase (GPIT) subunit GPI8
MTHNSELGVSVIDRFTYYTLEFFQRSLKPNKQDKEPSVQHLVSGLSVCRLLCTRRSHLLQLQTVQFV